MIRNVYCEFEARVVVKRQTNEALVRKKFYKASFNLKAVLGRERSRTYYV